MVIILIVFMAIYSGCIFNMSYNYSKTKYNYGKNERNIYEDVRGGEYRNITSRTT